MEELPPLPKNIDWVTLKQAAEYLGIVEATVAGDRYALQQLGVLKGIEPRDAGFSRENFNKMIRFRNLLRKYGRYGRKRALKEMLEDEQ